MTSLSLDRSRAPKAQQLHEMPVDQRSFGFHLIQPEFHLLDNGVPVHLFRHSTHSLIKFELVFKAGTAYQKQLLSAANTNRMLREGTSRYTSEQIADLSDFYGASILLTCDRDRATVGIICSSEFFESLLPLLSSMISEPLFPEKEFRNILGRQKQEFLVNLEKTSFLAQSSFTECLFGKNHPYGTRAMVEDFDRLETNHLQEFFTSCYLNGDLEIFTTCSHHYKIVPRINQWFGQHKASKGSPTAVSGSGPAIQTDTLQIVKENSVQSSIRIGRKVPGPNHPDYAPVKVFSTLLGGYFGSRLMRNIREDKGYTYGIGSNIVNLEQESYFVISTDVRTDVTQATFHEIFTEIQLLREQLVSEQELNLVKNYMLGSFLQSIDGPFSLAERFKEIRYFDLQSGFYENHLREIQNCTVEDIKRIGNQYFTKNTLIRVVAGSDQKLVSF